MSDETRSALRQAFDAIEAGDLESARAIIEPILVVEPDNADAWWVYSHAISDPEEAMTALDNVVRIDPEYPGAGELLSTLRERLPRRPVQPVTSSAPPAPSHFPDLPAADEPDFDIERTPPSGMKPVTVEEEAEEESQRSIIPMLAGILLVIVVLVLIVSLLSRTQTPALTPTAIAVATQAFDTTSIPFTLTEEPTSESQAVAPVTTETSEAISTTEVGATPTASLNIGTATAGGEADSTEAAPDATETSEPVVDATAESGVSSDGDEALLSGLGRFTLADEPITRQVTTVGNAVLVNVCVADRREVTTLLRPVMRAIANGTAALGSDVEAVGARMMNCTTGNPFVVFAVDRQSAMDHGAGTLSYVEFRERWQPQR